LSFNTILDLILIFNYQLVVAFGLANDPNIPTLLAKDAKFG